MHSMLHAWGISSACWLDRCNFFYSQHAQQSMVLSNRAVTKRVWPAVVLPQYKPRQSPSLVSKGIAPVLASMHPRIYTRRHSERSDIS